MRQTVVTLIDDLDGESSADEAVKFGLDGTEYEIDLSKKNAEKLRGTLRTYVDHARKTTGGRRGKRSGGTTFSDVDTKAVRAWAASNKVEVNARGRIPASVIEQYRTAGN